YDVVSSVGITMTALRKDEIEGFASWHEFLKLHQRSTQSYAGGGTIVSAWWRMMVGGYFDPPGTGTQPVSERIAVLFRYYAQQGQLGSFGSALLPACPSDMPEAVEVNAVAEDLLMCQSFISDVRNTLSGRRIFLTKKGYMGFGREDIRAGDVVGILPQVDKPLILRPTGSSATKFVNHGGCYVGGLMHGEALRGFDTASATTIDIV
ncbi:hypothetical protein LTR86_009978, partial [Recurvomyces mirabilis]